MLCLHENTSEIKFKDQLLYKDAEFVLREELREPRYYFSIIRSIASGNTSLGHIMNDTGLSKDVVSKYLVTLQDLDIIQRMWPITENPKSRKGIYRIKDNYFRFYFRFIFPNLEYIEIGEIDFLLEKIKEGYQDYLGGIFEDVLIEMDDDHNNEKTRTLIRDSWRITIFRDHGELYNLKEDPDEMNNLWGNKSFSEKKDELLLRLFKKCIRNQPKIIIRDCGF